MENTQQIGGGFTPHVMNQLQEMASEPPSHGRGRHRGRRGRSQYQRFELGHDQSHIQDPTSWKHNTSTQGNSPNVHPVQRQMSEAASFPPLGTAPPAKQQTHSQSQYPQNVQQQVAGNQAYGQPPPTHHSHPQHEFHGRGGRHGRHGGRSRGGISFSARSDVQTPLDHHDLHQRPPPAHGRLFNPGGNPHFGTADQQRAFRHRIMSQSDFLGTVASQALMNQISQDEFRAKEAFRKTIQEIAQNTIATNTRSGLSFDVSDVKLKLYGSLGSGFGVAGSDMDLLLTFPQTEQLQDGIEIESRRWLEKGLLDAGYGARLLTNTRVPILKVCEKPSQDLLANLRDLRQEWEESKDKGTEKLLPDAYAAPLPPQFLARTDIIQELEEVSLEAVEIPLPDSDSSDQTKVEFGGDCGIQCDINFTNYVALRNTELLRIYGQCDPRVRQVGLFVKYWAKARDINTPYKGTLSSYGYIMMVLHYLMNVVSPPVIPNLQMIAKDQDAWERRTEIETVEGFDVRFVRDPEQLRHIMASMKPNHESLGSLLRGFFWYYGCNGGFHWTRDVISIRSRGGQISKQLKGWTGAKWSESKQNVRLRYLLAIEDPFETEHNVGRTVGHSGIVAIRDEFRRAWAIIENVQLDKVRRVWIWSDATSGEQRDAQELVDKLENRGDLLRKDQVAHKDKMRQMRKEAELKEQVLRATQDEENKQSQDLIESLMAAVR